MDYVSAIVPPLVMAVGFTLLVRTIIKHQGGANRSREDAAVDAILARAEADRQTEAAVPGAAATGGGTASA
ncbi:hypothetical protein POF50_010125 [Streptomyces sp. SL13]|uniref:Uncharacterized protein n=1 Tax=Streptantibioticus silvisoli TaxID=2705255 RepID=A0AA90KFU3_9ACTN|nr:hypothetical protein [Streptantibioticus silvisoli]MDI5962862.1 hypothetical protein [Streptantibioticus silvisoli]MDI5969690.1 hypothetical protein [Streptantibioticus silvisoli]